MSTELTIPNVQLESDVHLVARNPNEMHLAKANLENWLVQKVAQTDKETDELFAAYEEAVKHKWAAKTLRNHGNLAKRRGDFYKKVLAAVQAGYTIVPNFPIDVFAVRVKRAAPKYEQSTSTYSQQDAIANAHEAEPDTLPYGEGRYVGTSVQGHAGSYQEKKKDGTEITRYFFTATDFTDIQFPIECARVEVISASAEAMALRVFDSVGICPQTRRGDPLIIGRILGPKVGYSRKEVSFLLAWHLDLRTL